MDELVGRVTVAQGKMGTFSKWSVPFLCPHSLVTSPEKLPMNSPAVWIINVNLVKFLEERSEKKELGGPKTPQRWVE
jgi:hypothetical protein